MSSNIQTIYVYFSHDTNKNGDPSGTDFICAEMFVEANTFGTGSHCSWASLREILIVVGNGFTLDVGSTLTLTTTSIIRAFDESSSPVRGSLESMIFFFFFLFLFF